jgi:hypothetical protein
MIIQLNKESRRELWATHFAKVFKISPEKLAALKLKLRAHNQVVIGVQYETSIVRLTFDSKDNECIVPGTDVKFSVSIPYPDLTVSHSNIIVRAIADELIARGKSNFDKQNTKYTFYESKSGQKVLDTSVLTSAQLAKLESKWEAMGLPNKITAIAKHYQIDLAYNSFMCILKHKQQLNSFIEQVKESNPYFNKLKFSGVHCIKPITLIFACEYYGMDLAPRFASMLHNTLVGAKVKLLSNSPFGVKLHLTKLVRDVVGMLANSFLDLRLMTKKRQSFLTDALAKAIECSNLSEFHDNLIQIVNSKDMAVHGKPSQKLNSRALFYLPHLQEDQGFKFIEYMSEFAFLGKKFHNCISGYAAASNERGYHFFHNEEIVVCVKNTLKDNTLFFAFQEMRKDYNEPVSYQEASYAINVISNMITMAVSAYNKHNGKNIRAQVDSNVPNGVEECVPF